MGTKEASGSIKVTDAIPLFHQRVTSAPLEVAFNMIGGVIKTQNLQMVGVYESPLAIKSDGTASQLAQHVAE